MKVRVYLIKASIIIIFFTMLISVVLSFFVEECNISIFINNIMLNIFAGAVIMLVTSITEYILYKKKQIDNLIKKVLKIGSVFSKLQYMQEIEFMSFDEYKKNRKKKYKNVEELKLHLEYNDYTKGKIFHFDEIIDEYKIINNIDITEIGDIYSDIKFMFNNKKMTEKIYSEIYKPIYDEVNKIHRLVFHINNKPKNIVIYDLIRKYQNDIFKTKKINEDKDDKIIEEIINSGTSYEIIRFSDKNNSLLIYNDFTKKLYENYEYLNKL